MSRFPRSIAALMLFLPVQAFAFGSDSAPKYGIDVEYQSRSNIDLQNFNQTSLGNLPTNLNGNYKNNQLLGKLSYRAPGGIQFSLIAGAATSGTLALTSYAGGGSTSYNSETLTFGSSPTYGASIGWEMFPNSPIHLIPSITWLHTNYSGTAGSVYNSNGNCSYSFGGGANTNSCSTVLGLSSSNATTIQSNFTAIDTTAKLAVAFDLFGDPATAGLSLYGGVDENVTTVSGQVAYTAVAGSTSVQFGTESFGLSPWHQVGAFAGLSGHISAVQFGFEYDTWNQNMILGRLGVQF